MGVHFRGLHTCYLSAPRLTRAVCIWNVLIYSADGRVLSLVGVTKSVPTPRARPQNATSPRELQFP